MDNFTTWAQARESDADFQRCWRLQNCGDCLSKEKGCSWCPFSWTCVPNPYALPLLKPAWDGDDTCPHWAERWEIRTRPLGCHVSTITTLTSIVSITGTIVFFLILFFLVWLVKRVVRFTKAGGFAKWRKTLSRGWDRAVGSRAAAKEPRRSDSNSTDEREPLLPS